MAANKIWEELYTVAPELIPLTIQVVIDVEKVVVGTRRGEIRKSRVMSILGNILDTKTYFVTKNPDQQLQFLNLMSKFVDVIVSTFNYAGVFATSIKREPPIPPSPLRGEGKG